jgi:aminoglycoside/choline kinase family phosphotransferase
VTAEAAFLDAAGWGGAGSEPIPTDASGRAYLRLRRAGRTAILMRAPVADDPAARAQFDAFRRIAAWLSENGFAAPEEIAVDAASGLLLMEDLGETPLSRLLGRDAAEAEKAYAAAVDVLSDLARIAPPPGLSEPDPAGIAAMTGVTFDRLPETDALRDRLQGALAEAIRARPQPPAVSLRDVHGDNLIWRPDAEGRARVGLLDFQDALILPRGYDLASLLDDPRRDVPETWRASLIARHAEALGMEAEAMGLAVDLMSLQRNMRILGIFRRLSAGMGRPAYARFLPRTRALLLRAAANPALGALAEDVAELVARSRAWTEEPA